MCVQISRLLQAKESFILIFIAAGLEDPLCRVGMIVGGAGPILMPRVMLPLVTRGPSTRLVLELKPKPGCVLIAGNPATP